MNAPLRTHLRRLGLVGSLLLAPILLLSAVLIATQSQANASSHREAPLISKDAFADNTDTYVFISPADEDNVVLVGSWIPFEGPEGGPNYFEWDDSALYDLYVDNDGDAQADITYTLSSKVEVKNLNTFLYNVNSITSLGDPDWNRQQFITVTETTADGASTVLIGNKSTAPVNIGEKSTPNYQALADEAIYDAADGVPGNLKVFAGQTDDPFWVDLQVFDLLTLRGQNAPVGYTIGANIPVDSLSGFNVHSLVVEVPIARLKQGDEPVLGVWAGTRRSATRVIQPLNTISNSSSFVQVSRLGMPLVNEVVIPLQLKDAFNAIPPSVDAILYTTGGPGGAAFQKLLQKSVEDPEIGNLLCTLYSVPLPGDANNDCKTDVQYISDVGASGLRSGRGDIFDIFLTGMKLAAPFTIQTKSGPMTLPAGFNVNQPANVVPAEMIRINTNIKGDLCSPTPSRLGVLGGDACGFPNGRRLTDDVVEIELLAVAGAAYPVLDGRDTNFTFNPVLIDVLSDGIDHNDVPYYKNSQLSAAPANFPYLGLAQSGQDHLHANPLFYLLFPRIEMD
ncbi:MAG: DUF4331 domain-containing protein [Caldilineaceae bacterium]|nr:DUF4331 domain-containing protein [Caldilineaceae bacterium]